MKANRQTKRLDVPGLAGLKELDRWVDVALKRSAGEGLTETQAICFANKLRANLEEMESYLRNAGALPSRADVHNKLASEALFEAERKGLL